MARLPDDMSRLEQINTNWTTIGDPARREKALRRYEKAIRGYMGVLMRGVSNPATEVDDLWQDFANRFIEGRFSSADPNRGKFRYYVRTCVRHLAFARLRKLARETAESKLSADDLPATTGDAEFDSLWRDTRIDQALERMAEEDPEKCKVMRFLKETAQENLTSEEMAPRLGAILGRELNSGSVRKRVHAAREKFAEILIEDIRFSLEDDSPDNVAQELIDVGLYEYCKHRLPRVDGNRSSSPE